jgi:hypothetical protein
VTKPARFEDEADAEYRAAGRWYEERVVGLGIDFFDAVDATVEQMNPQKSITPPGQVQRLVRRVSEYLCSAPPSAMASNDHCFTYCRNETSSDFRTCHSMHRIGRKVDR